MNDDTGKLSQVDGNDVDPAGEPGDDEAPEQFEEVGPRTRPARFWHDILIGREKQPKVAQLLVEEVENRWSKASPRLKGLVAGRIELKIGETTHVFNWRGESVGVEAGNSADCRIELSESTLLRIAAGELNPQVAMLSEKVRIHGNSGLAVYFFNLIAPRN